MTLALPYPNDPVDRDAIWSRPSIDPTAWISPGAQVSGRVVIKAHASVWYNCVLRGDSEYIEVGEECNVQDGSILHTDRGHPCVLGNRVSLGHNAIVHGSVVQEGALIGIAARVLTGCHIGAGALVGAGALLLEGTQVPPHTLWVGSPAKLLKELSPQQRERVAYTYRYYVNNTALYLERYGRAHIDALVVRPGEPRDGSRG